MNASEMVNLLHKYNQNHPEYNGMASIRIFDDFSGDILDQNVMEIHNTEFLGKEELLKVLSS